MNVNCSWEEPLSFTGFLATVYVYISGRPLRLERIRVAASLCLLAAVFGKGVRGLRTLCLLAARIFGPGGSKHTWNMRTLVGTIINTG